MRISLPVARAAAIVPRVSSVAESPEILHPTLSSGLPDDAGDRWFADIAQQFYPKPEKPGAVLRCLTGYEERSCQRYAAADAQPPGHLVRQLLRSPHGEQWLGALMEGSEEPWWLDLQRHARMGRAAESVR